MNITVRFRTIFTLLAALFICMGAEAQTNTNTSTKKKSSKNEKVVQNTPTTATEDAEKEEVEYYYSYVVVDVINEYGSYSLKMDDKSIQNAFKLPSAQTQKAKKAVSSGMKFESESELLNFMGSLNYELVSVLGGGDNNKGSSKMYFRIKLER